MSYNQNLNIRSTALRHGYITKNDRVHGVTDATDTMYGATAQGGLGYGNHNVLRSMFTHPNAVIDRTVSESLSDIVSVTDYDIAIRIQRDRDNLSGDMSLINEMRERFDALTQERSQYRQRRRTEDANYNPDSDPDDRDYESRLGHLRDYIDSPETANIVNAIAAESEIGTAYNPDFPLGDVSFAYASSGTSRASNDLGSETQPHSPNVAFPSADGALTDPDTSKTYTEGFKGGGGFGTTASDVEPPQGSNTNNTPIITEILSVYDGAS